MSGFITAEELYLQYHDKVERYIRSHVSGVDDREDLVHQVFLNAMSAIDSYDLTKASPGTWLYTITRNAVTDYYRQRQRGPVLVELHDVSAVTGDDAEELTLRQEMLEILADALESLPARERDIVVWRFYHGLSAQETAEKVGVSYANARFLQHSAMKKLRVYLERAGIA